MKTTLNHFITILIILTILVPKNIFSQDNEGLFGALAVGAAAAAISIENNKEILESMASNHIFANYPQYKEFRLSTIGWGDGGKRLSDNGMMRLYPFAITELNKSIETKNRKLLLLFASPGWVTEFGIDYTKLSWHMFSDKDWNRLLSIFSMLNSPYNATIKSNLIPVYKKISIKDYTSDELKNINLDLETFVISNSKGLFNLYQKDENNSHESIKNLKFTKEGWKLKNKLIYQFYNLKGDDYIIDDYSETLKIFSNEDALGLFLIKEQDQMLVRFSIINKIHQFINNQN